MHADSPDESDLFVVDAEEETYTKVLPTATHTSSYSVVASTIEGGNNNRDRGSHALGTHAHGVHFPASKSASTDDTIDDKSDAFPRGGVAPQRSGGGAGGNVGQATDMAVVEDEDVVIERALCVTSEPCLLQGDGPSTLARAIRWPCATSASQVDSTAPDPLRFQDARTLSAISNVLAMMESRATASHRDRNARDWRVLSRSSASAGFLQIPEHSGLLTPLAPEYKKRSLFQKLVVYPPSRSSTKGPGSCSLTL